MLSLLLKGEETDRDCGSIMQTMHGGCTYTAWVRTQTCPPLFMADFTDSHGFFALLPRRGTKNSRDEARSDEGRILATERAKAHEIEPQGAMKNGGCHCFESSSFCERISL